MSNSRTALGEILSPAGEAVDVSTLTTVPYAGVHWYAEGVYHRDDVPAEKVRAKKLRRISRGQVVYNRMWATKAAFGVVDQSADGCLVTNDFPVFVTDGTRLMPEFLRLVFASPGFQSEAAARATGTTERRRLKERDFLLIKIPLPAPEEQRRIVDLISSIDQSILSGERHESMLSSARGYLLNRLLEPQKGWAETTLGDVAEITIGRTPPRKDPRYWTVDLERPFCTIAELEPLTIPKREGVTALAEEEGKAKRFPKGSLLMSFKLTIGRVGFAGVDLFPNEAIARLKPRSEDTDDRFLALALEAQNLEEYAGKAVKGNTLTREAIEAIPLTLPPLLEQRRIVDLISSIDLTLDRVRNHVTAMKALRSQTLGDLLSGQHEIPDSYDRFLEEAS